jgi:hypothetical protein
MQNTSKRRVSHYLTHDEAAAMLRMSQRGLHELVSKRAVPHRRISGARRILYLEAEGERRALDDADNHARHRSTVRACESGRLRSRRRSKEPSVAAAPAPRASEPLERVRTCTHFTCKSGCAAEWQSVGKSLRRSSS